jgi:hypothetical protein
MAVSAYPETQAYEMTEAARLLLGGAEQGELGSARRAAGEAAYYLSDVMEPDDRAQLLAAVERHLSGEDPGGAQEHAGDALALLADASGEVERLLRGPSASSELHIALRALRRTVRHLTNHIRVGEHPASMSLLRRRRLSPSSVRARR